MKSVIGNFLKLFRYKPPTYDYDVYLLHFCNNKIEKITLNATNRHEADILAQEYETDAVHVVSIERCY